MLRREIGPSILGRFSSARFSQPDTFVPPLRARRPRRGAMGRAAVVTPVMLTWRSAASSRPNLVIRWDP